MFASLLLKLTSSILLSTIWNFDVFDSCGPFDEKYSITNAFEFEFPAFDFLDI